MGQHKHNPTYELLKQGKKPEKSQTEAIKSSSPPSSMKKLFAMIACASMQEVVIAERYRQNTDNSACDFPDSDIFQ